MIWTRVQQILNSDRSRTLKLNVFGPRLLEHFYIIKFGAFEKNGKATPASTPALHTLMLKILFHCSDSHSLHSFSSLVRMTLEGYAYCVSPSTRHGDSDADLPMKLQTAQFEDRDCGHVVTFI